MILTNSGVLKLMQRIKSFITSQLNTKANSVHTHTISEIDDLSNLSMGGGYTKSESDDKFVDKTSNQTIDGVKTFSKNITVKDNANTTGKDLLYLIDDTIKQSNEDENGFPLTGHTNSLKIRGHDNNMISCMLTGQVFTNGDTSAELRAYKYKDIVSDNCRSILSIRYRFADNKGLFTITNIDYLQSSHTNTTNLGSPALQWNNTYTRNILIDNDINIASSIINKTSTSGSLAIRCGTNYTDGASIGMYGKDYNSGMAGAVTINAYGNSDYTNLYIYPNGTISVYNNSTNTTKNLAMQEDVNTLLSGKANSSHTHTVSNITDFPTIPSKTSDLTNDSGFLTSHQDLSGYVPRSGGAVISGNTFSRIDNSGHLSFNSGTSWNNGASISLVAKDASSDTGIVLIKAQDITSYNQIALTPSGNFKMNVNGTVKNVAMYEDVIPRGGGAVITGDALSRNINTSFLRIDGGSGWEQGSSIVVSGKDRTDSVGGGIGLHASNGTQSYTMSLRPDGTITWGSKNLAMQEDTVPRSAGSVITGTTLGRVDNSAYLNLSGGLNWNNGATVSLLGKDTESNAGNILLHPNDGTQAKTMWLRPNGTWLWDGQPVQISSDQRLKQQINQIDNNLLDAWEDVTLVQFKYNDAVNEKGNAARLHTGYVVQQIDDACKSHNIDISNYGLYCHEEYPQETEEVEVKQDDGTIKKETKVIREASEHYSLRYTETLVVECAYLRRENNRLKERLSKIEKLLNI